MKIGRDQGTYTEKKSHGQNKKKNYGESCRDRSHPKVEPPLTWGAVRSRG